MAYYLGRRPQGDLVRFQSAHVPTQASHGHRFTAAIGPFKTLLGTEWYFRYGQNNPHVVTTADAEQFALTDDQGAWPLVREQLLARMSLTPAELEAAEAADALEQAEFNLPIPVSLPVQAPVYV